MLGIVIVAYKSAQMTIDFINREMKNVDVSWVCCIVNNAATKEDTEMISRGTGAEIADKDLKAKQCIEGGVYIVPSSENLGFAKGNNLGTEFLLKNFKCDYLLFSNNDIEIMSSHCLSTLIRTLESDNRIGAIGPRVVNKEGVEQAPHDRCITPYRQIGWMLFPFLRKKKAICPQRTEEHSDIIRHPAGFTYWVQGSFMVMRMVDFLAVDMFDPNTFLYTEEPIMAEKLKRIGKRMYYENSVTVLHYEGGTIVKKHGRAQSEEMVMESNCYYYSKYLNYSWVLVRLYKMIFKITQ